MSAPSVLGVGVPPRVKAPAISPASALDGSRAFATVRVASSFDAVADAWASLEARAAVSPYQQRAWLQVWAETDAPARRMTVAIVVAEDAGGRPVALLPLGLVPHGIVSAAVFLGGRETNYNMGLFAPDLAWSREETERLLREAARQMHPKPDVFFLAHQPGAWAGLDNPLAAIPRRQPSPSYGHRVALRRDGTAFLREHQSAAARKKLRGKATRLALFGPVVHRVVREPEAIDAAVAAHLAQKAAKLAAIGLAMPDSAALHRLFVRAASPRSDGTTPPLELHALYCGETIVATFGGLSHQGRFSGLLISYAVEPHYARCSPGELLLTEVLKAKCAEGLLSFDLGIGEARYKDTYCPIADPLIDVFLPLTVRGHLHAAAQALALRLKSMVKQSPRAWALARTLRKALRTGPSRA